nr:reverse transcriptase domain-containing protein [Tanacetum cinerariifolium]
PIPSAPVLPAGQHVALEFLTAHTAWIKGSKEIARIMLMTMEPDIQRNLETLHAHEMLLELKTLFAQQAEHELLQTTRDFHSCKQEEGKSVSSYVLKMKGYIDNLERLGHPVTLGLGFIEYNIWEELNSVVGYYDDKLPVIIAKDLSVEEKTALIMVLKLQKQAIAWKLSDIKDQEKTTFTCPYGTFAYCRMPFGLCNAPGTFQRCMMAIFDDMIEKTMEVFMDDFLVFGNSFQSFLSHLERMLKRCEGTNLCLNWEKSHFMVKEGIVLGHKISMQGIEVDKAKVDVITKLPHSTTVKGIRSVLGHAGFYRRFIKDFSKIARPMTRLLEKDTSFIFSKVCVEAFQTLKGKLTEALILIAPDWDMPFELMCDASDFAIGVVLGQQGVYQARKPLKFSRLATMDPSGDTMA